ncbi:histone H2A deubiquitinase [Trifolium repens]|nr:histone H2A deubiquitinase [Trifolium repens]
MTLEDMNRMRQIRDNIIRMINEMNDSPEVMKQMPPLVKMNEELINSILPFITNPLMIQELSLEKKKKE